MTNQFRTLASQNISDIKLTFGNLFHRFNEGSRLLAIDIINPRQTLQNFSAHHFQNSKHADLRLQNGLGKFLDTIMENMGIETKSLLNKNTATSMTSLENDDTDSISTDSSMETESLLKTQLKATQEYSYSSNDSFIKPFETAIDKSIGIIAKDPEYREAFEAIDSERFNHGAFINTHRQAAVLNLQENFIRPGQLFYHLDANKQKSIDKIADHYKTLIKTCLQELDQENYRALSQNSRPKALFITIKGSLPVNENNEFSSTMHDLKHFSNETKGQIAAKKELCKAVVKAGATDALLKSGLGDDTTIQHYLSRYSKALVTQTHEINGETGSTFIKADYSRAHRIRIDLNPLKMPFKLLSTVIKEPVRGARNLLHKALGNPIKMKSPQEILKLLADNTQRIKHINDQIPSLDKQIKDADSEFTALRDDYESIKNLPDSEYSSSDKSRLHGEVVQAKNDLNNIQNEKNRKIKEQKKLETKRLELQKRLFKLMNPSQYEITRANQGLVKSHSITGRGEFSGFVDTRNLKKTEVELRIKPEFRQQVFQQAIDDAKQLMLSNLENFAQLHETHTNAAYLRAIKNTIQELSPSNVLVSDEDKNKEKYGLTEDTIKPEWEQFSLDPLKKLPQATAQDIKEQIRTQVRNALNDSSDSAETGVLKDFEASLGKILKQVYKPSAALQQSHLAEQRTAVFQGLGDTIDTLRIETSKQIIEPVSNQLHTKLDIANQYTTAINKSDSFEPLKAQFHHLIRSNQRSEVFGMLHGILDEIEAHHSFGNIDHQKGTGTENIIHIRIQAVREQINSFKLHNRNAPQDVIIQNMFDSRNADLLRGSQRAMQNDIHAMTEALPQVLGMAFAFKDELQKSTFMIDKTQHDAFSANLERVLTSQLSIQTDTPKTLKIESEDILKAQLTQVFKNALIKQPSLKAEDLIKVIKSIEDVKGNDCDDIISALMFFTTYQNLNKFSATSINKNQLDQFYFDGIDSPLKKSSMPLYMALRNTDKTTMGHVETAYTQTINPISKVYFNTWAKAMAVSQQLGTVHVFHSPQWLIGPPVFNIADMVNSIITSTLVGLTTFPLARAVKQHKDDNISRNFESFAESDADFDIFEHETELGTKTPSRPTEDRVFKTLGNWARLDGDIAGPNKLMSIKTFDRRTPAEFKEIEHKIKGSENTLELLKPQGLSYKSGITRVKHSQLLQDMKQATLPLGREALTATAKLFKSPYTGIKAAYKDLAGEYSMRNYSAPVKSDITNESLSMDSVTERNSVINEFSRRIDTLLIAFNHMSLSSNFGNSSYRNSFDTMNAAPVQLPDTVLGDGNTILTNALQDKNRLIEKLTNANLLPYFQAELATLNHLTEPFEYPAFI